MGTTLLEDAILWRIWWPCWCEVFEQEPINAHQICPLAWMDSTQVCMTCWTLLNSFVICSSKWKLKHSQCPHQMSSILKTGRMDVVFTNKEKQFQWGSGSQIGILMTPLIFEVPSNAGTFRGHIRLLESNFSSKFH